ncbi:unnamed protein product [Gadus morhua 'NCC']
MLTIHAIGWNKRKQDGLHLALSCRYVKTLQKAEAASQKLSDLCSDLDCPEDMVHQWVEDVRQWAKADAVGTGSDDQHQLQKSIEEIFLGVHQKKENLYNQTDSNKIRNLRRRKLWTEKKKLFEKIWLYNQQEPEEERIVEEKDTNYRRSISAAERLSICLRFLATGDSFRTIATSFRVGASTVAFIVSDGWRIYRRVIEVRPELAERCVKATCVLHNLLRRTAPTAEVRDCLPVGVVLPLPGLGRVAANNAGREAMRIRETFTSYFSAEGTVSWHDTIV